MEVIIAPCYALPSFVLNFGMALLLAIKSQVKKKTFFRLELLKSRKTNTIFQRSWGWGRMQTSKNPRENLKKTIFQRSWGWWWGANLEKTSRRPKKPKKNRGPGDI
jgi:hypothetical protein